MQHVVTIRTAVGAVLVLVALGGQTLPNDGVKNKTVHFWRAWTVGSSLMDDGEHTSGATPFSVVKVKPNMMIWSMLVQCECVEDQAAIKETVESLNRPGFPELIVRSYNDQ